ncbi:alpha/beta hydrolase [Uruburuella testudinis]|uniref:Alpha/beta hydrolase n=1 Tax=Uruburuella testudinis TaxID=1282863 RepID=A0ABY4DRW3_9NEIS|nr:alpha/beta hydrolase [Uruburuella testudinis]UOO81352.1 alpha/beta hydrolase [Uruburuella testudinis]
MNKAFTQTALFTLTALAAFSVPALAGDDVAKLPAAQAQSEAEQVYSRAHRLSLAENRQKVHYLNGDIRMAANIYYPDHFDRSKRYPAVIVGHPGGGVKEQASGLYAKLLAQKGYVAIAFDASHQGESGGLPRHLNDPYKRVGDFSATLDYLATLPFVDAERIGVLGICASGGFSANAAINDKRIKALATVSAFVRYNTAWDGTPMSAAAQAELLSAVAAQRNLEAQGAAVKTIPYLEPVNADTPPDLAAAYEYYLTPRGRYPTAQNQMTMSSLGNLITFDALNSADKLLTQPLLVISGDQSGSLWQSRQVFEQAGSTEKELFLIKGANHMSMYDNLDDVNQAVDKLTVFFGENL